MSARQSIQAQRNLKADAAVKNVDGAGVDAGAGGGMGMMALLGLPMVLPLLFGSGKSQNPQNGIPSNGIGDIMNNPTALTGVAVCSLSTSICCCLVVVLMMSR